MQYKTINPARFMAYFICITGFLLYGYPSFSDPEINAHETKNIYELPHMSLNEPLKNYIELGWNISEALAVEDLDASALSAYDEWHWFKTRLQPGDEIRRITSPADYWQNHAGTDALVLIRNEIIIHDLILMTN